MSLPTLLLPPDQANYVAKEGHTVVSAQLDGGAGRYRADQLGGSFQVTVRWTCDDVNYNYLKAFYRSAISFGSLPFIIGLYLDSATIQNYTAYIVSDSFELRSQSGLTFVCEAILECIPDPTYYLSDAAIIAAGPDTI